MEGIGGVSCGGYRVCPVEGIGVCPVEGIGVCPVAGIGVCPVRGVHKWTGPDLVILCLLC